MPTDPATTAILTPTALRQAMVEAMRLAICTSDEPRDTRCKDGCFLEKKADGRRCPYLPNAEAALSALAPVLAAHGYKVVGREPSEAAWIAGRDPFLYRDSRAPQSQLDMVPWYDREKDGSVRPDFYVTKGTGAVWTWRAMHDAATCAITGRAVLSAPNAEKAPAPKPGRPGSQ